MKFVLVVALVSALATAFIPSATAQTNLFASSTTGVFTFTLGGANQGSFISGATSSNFRRLTFGADRTGDGTNDLYVGDDTIGGIRIFNGVSGAFDHSYSPSPGGQIRELAVDPTNLSLYYANLSRIGRRAADESFAPGTGQTGDTFVSGSSMFSVIIGPDLKVYLLEGATLRRFSTAGGTAEKSQAVTCTLCSHLEFGQDVTGDGLPELYASDFSGGQIRVFNVLANPSSWTQLSDAIAFGGTANPVGFAFHDDDMYVALTTAGRIARYRWSGSSWNALPSPGNTGDTFATLAGAQDVFFPIPEPMSASLVLAAALLLWRKR